MTDRRGHARIVVANNEGVLQEARDVTVISTDPDLVAICGEPATLGDALTLEMVVDGLVDRIAVRVKESRPIVVAEAIRYRIRMTRENPSGQAAEDDTRRGRSEWKADQNFRVVRRGPGLPD